MPDVVLMDVRMPKRSGIEATTQIRDLMPHVKILMLTISDEEADLYDAIKAGASGYLLKEIPIEEVADAIRSVWAGQSRISPSMASKLLTEFAAISKQSNERPQMPAPRLTDREMEVLRLVAQGLNNRDIAKQLFISENTVKNHIRNILEKLHLHSRMEAVVYAVREKMIEIDVGTRPPGNVAHPAGAWISRFPCPSSRADTVESQFDAATSVPCASLAVADSDARDSWMPSCGTASIDTSGSLTTKNPCSRTGVVIGRSRPGTITSTDVAPSASTRPMTNPPSPPNSKVSGMTSVA